MFDATDVQCQTILRHQVGDSIEAKRTLRRSAEAGETGAVAVFSEGRSYQVLEVLPMIPALVVIDDEGERNKIVPDFLADNFTSKTAASW